jgi:hypothetical protein
MICVSDRGAAWLSQSVEPIDNDGEIYAFGILAGEVKRVEMLISLVLVEL